jgi:hypothetical protein
MVMVHGPWRRSIDGGVMSPVKTGRALDLQRHTLALRTRDVRGWLQACQTTCQSIFNVALPPSRRASEKDPGKDVPRL